MYTMCALWIAVGALMFLGGLGVFATAKGVMHEIFASMWLLGAFLMWSFAGVFAGLRPLVRGGQQPPQLPDKPRN